MHSLSCNFCRDCSKIFLIFALNNRISQLTKHENVPISSISNRQLESVLHDNSDERAGRESFHSQGPAGREEQASPSQPAPVFRRKSLQPIGPVFQFRRLLIRPIAAERRSDEPVEFLQHALSGLDVHSPAYSAEPELQPLPVRRLVFETMFVYLMFS